MSMDSGPYSNLLALFQEHRPKILYVAALVSLIITLVTYRGTFFDPDERIERYSENIYLSTTNGRFSFTSDHSITFRPSGENLSHSIIVPVSTQMTLNGQPVTVSYSLQDSAVDGSSVLNENQEFGSFELMMFADEAGFALKDSNGGVKSRTLSLHTRAHFEPDTLGDGDSQTLQFRIAPSFHVWVDQVNVVVSLPEGVNTVRANRVWVERLGPDDGSGGKYEPVSSNLKAEVETAGSEAATSASARLHITGSKLLATDRIGIEISW